ncbi:MAG TPA: chondroitinase family protein, partial [Sphingobacteriaceae bacterium]
MKIFLVFACLFIANEASGQLKHEGFNNRIPSNWSSTSGSTMSLSDEHFQGGGQSLKWTTNGEAKITISNLAIPAADISSSASGSAQFFIYSKEPSNDTLVFQFLDKAGIVKREGHMLLNYKGWRDYHRSYRFDYNNGNELPEFELSKCLIIYKPVEKGSTKTIWFDEMRFIGDTERRFPGPHMLLDARHFYQSASTAGGDSKRHLVNWGKGPDIPVKAASVAELKALKKVAAAYHRPVPDVTAADLKAAKDYVLKSSIKRNQDNTIKGRAITSLTNQDTLVMLANHCGSLARAYRKNNDKDARDKLLLFTEYLLDQGLAEGGRNVITTNTYAEARTFPVGFLEALPIYSPAMRSDIIKMLKWSLEYNQIYDPDFILRLNIDYIHVKSNFLFEIAVSDPSPDVAVRDLKCIKRFFELNS